MGVLDAPHDATITGGVRCPHDAPHCGGASDTPVTPPMLFFDNLVKQTRQTITENQLQTLISIHLHWKCVLIIC